MRLLLVKADGFTHRSSRIDRRWAGDYSLLNQRNRKNDSNE